MTWEQLYDFFRIKDFIYFISSPSLQDSLFGIKLIFIAFTVFFLCAVIWFYLNSSYIQYQFLQDAAEFFSWEPYGLREVNRRWKRIVKKAETGGVAEFKLALIEADDFLFQTLQNRDFQGETFEDLMDSAGKRMLPNYDDIVEAHTVRNAIVYEPDYKLDVEKARKHLASYESAIKNIAVS